MYAAPQICLLTTPQWILTISSLCPYSLPKVSESDKDGASAKSIPVSKVEQAEPKREEEVPADNGKPEVREEEASRSVCSDTSIMLF